MSPQNQDGMNQRKKVLFLITKATWGGAQRYVFDLATHLDSKKYQPIVAFGTTGKLSGNLVKAGIKTYQIPSLGRDIALISDVASFFQIIRCIRNVRPDVLHLNSSKAAALGALAGRLCGVPKIIFTVHGWPFKEDRNFLVQWAIYCISWFTAHLSHMVIVVSKVDEQWAKRTSIRHKYIPHGITEINTLEKETARKFLSDRIGFTLSANVRIIGTIAELTRNKGLEYGIKAVAELRRRHAVFLYIIIGSGELRSELEIRAKSLGLENIVFFTGFIENAARYLSAFDYFLLSSIKEGLPYVLLEASATARPIVATEVGGIPEILEHYEKGKMVNPKNPRELADAIVELENQRHIADLEQINRVLKRFSFSKMLTDTIKLYR